MPLLYPPTEDQVDVIKESIGEVSERFENNLRIFEKWAECQEYLPKNIDRGMLSIFLRAVKHDMEAAKKKLQLFMIARKNVPELFCNRDITDPQISKIFENLVCLPLPKQTPEGNRITIFSLRSKEISEFDMDLILKIVFLYADYRVRKEFLNAGDVYIFDAKNFTGAHTSKFLTSSFKKTLFILQEALPMRIRGIYIVNIWPFMDKLINVCKMLLKEKIRQRVVASKDMSFLTDIIPVECLPVEYGGTEKDVEALCKSWREHFEQESEWYRRMDDDKIVGDLPKDFDVHSDLFDESVQGSFRKLDID